MTGSRHFHATLFALSLGVALAAPAWASSTTSSASSAGSASVGSVSDSIQNSSESSSGDGRTAQGEYRVTHVAAVAEKPGMLRLTLARAESGDGFDLVLPEQAAVRGGVAVGETVRAVPTPYGTEFARADARQPFFLVLEDRWYRELATNPV